MAAWRWSAWRCGDGAVEDQAAHPPFVRRRIGRQGYTGLTAQVGVEGAHARAHAGVAETDADRVVAEVGAHPRRRRLSPAKAHRRPISPSGSTKNVS